MEKIHIGEKAKKCFYCGRQTYYLGNLKVQCVSCNKVISAPISDEWEYCESTTEDDIVPLTLQKSRPWKWAQKLRNIGNPYSLSTDHYKIFETLDEKGPLTPLGLFTSLCEKYPEMDICSSYWKLYEVCSRCMMSGLIILRKDGKMEIFRGPGKPVQNLGLKPKI